MSNSKAYSWFQSKLDTLVKLGIKGYKIDRGEEGEQPDAVQNENVDLFAKMAYQGLTATTIPLFVKEGAIIPRGDILKSNNSGYAYNTNTHLLTVSFKGATTLVLNSASSIFS